MEIGSCEGLRSWDGGRVEEGGLYCLVFKSSFCHLALGVDGWRLLSWMEEGGGGDGNQGQGRNPAQPGSTYCIRHRFFLVSKDNTDVKSKDISF